MISKFQSESFIFCWPGDEPVTVAWAGESFLIPGRNAVAITYAEDGVKTAIYRYPSAKDAAGNKIPGTVSVKDVIEDDAGTGGQAKIFDARAFAIGVETNNKPLLARGLEIVQNVEEVPAALEKGRPRYEESRAAGAEQELRDELERQAYWERKGQPAPVSSSAVSVRAAAAFLKDRAQKAGQGLSKNDLLEALGAAPIQTAPAPVKVPAAPVPDDTKLSQDLLARCEEANVNLTKAELVGLLKQDILVMNAVSEKLERASVAA